MKHSIEMVVFCISVGFANVALGKCQFESGETRPGYARSAGMFVVTVNGVPAELGSEDGKIIEIAMRHRADDLTDIHDEKTYIGAICFPGSSAACYSFGTVKAAQLAIQALTLAGKCNGI